MSLCRRRHSSVNFLLSTVFQYSQSCFKKKKKIFVIEINKVVRLMKSLSQCWKFLNSAPVLFAVYYQQVVGLLPWTSALYYAGFTEYGPQCFTSSKTCFWKRKVLNINLKKKHFGDRYSRYIRTVKGLRIHMRKRDALLMTCLSCKFFFSSLLWFIWYTRIGYYINRAMPCWKERVQEMCQQWTRTINLYFKKKRRGNKEKTTSLKWMSSSTNPKTDTVFS